ncbi:MAG: tetratricopeptide repeat protein [Syntrophales bacterium]|nr:tetratricopeptide repeat protein [Syntrophales bacterium]
MSCSLPQIVVLEDPLSAAEHNDLGVAYENKGKFGLAEKEYRKAVKQKDDWATPYLNLGNLYYRQGNFEKAEHSLRKALAIDPSDPDILNNLAHILFIQGRRMEAERFIKQALAIDPKPEYLDTLHQITGSGPSNN